MEPHMPDHLFEECNGEMMTLQRVHQIGCIWYAQRVNCGIWRSHDMGSQLQGAKISEKSTVLVCKYSGGLY